jgi:C-terminal processing protease CtpA/Prc
MVGGTGTAKEFDALLDRLNDKYQFKLAKQRAGMGPSDHQSFYIKQIPVFFFYTGNHQQYHTPADTVATINVPGIRRIVDLVDELMTNVSTMERRPEYVRVTDSFNAFDNPDRVVMKGPRLGVMPNYADEKEGVLLDGVTDGGPAAKAGLKAGDRIVEMGGKPVKNLAAYMTIMGGFKKGDKFDLAAIRDGKPQKFQVVLE